MENPPPAPESSPPPPPVSPPPPIPDFPPPPPGVPLTAATPPPLPEPPGFTLGLAEWIACGLIVAVKIALFVGRPGAATAYEMGYFLGGLTAMLVLPMAIAWVVWRLAGRSTIARMVAFFGILAVTILGQFAQFASQRARATAALNEFTEDARRSREKQRRAFEAGKPLDPKEGEEAARRASQQLDEVARNSSGDERALAEASKAYMTDLLGAKKHYDAALAAIHADTFWDLDQFDTAEKTAERRQQVNAFLAANARMAEYQDTPGTALRRNLVAANIPAAKVEATIKGYQGAGGARLSAIEKIRACDTIMGEAMLDFLTFADTYRGQWHTDDAGKLTLPAGTLKSYNEILARVRKAGEDQAEYQKQALGAGKK